MRSGTGEVSVRFCAVLLVFLTTLAALAACGSDDEDKTDSGAPGGWGGTGAMGVAGTGGQPEPITTGGQGGTGGAEPGPGPGDPGPQTPVDSGGPSAGGGGTSTADAGQAGSGGSIAPDAGAPEVEAGTESPQGEGGVEQPDGGADAEPPDEVDAGPVTVADYNEPGPYGVVRELNQATGTVSGGSSALLPAGHDNDPSGFTLFYPDGVQPGETFPILTFGNGTMCSPTFYDEFINHVVSYGYIVIAPNTSNTGSAVEMLQGVEWVIEQNDNPSSPLYGMVDTEKIGATGHSQGGAGTCRAGADPRVDAVATLSGTSEVAQIQCPAFFLTSGGEAGDSPDERINSTLSQTTQPSMYGVSVGGTHDEYADIVDEGVAGLIGLTSNDGLYSRGPVAAWFDWQLKGMDEVAPLFLEDPCGFCNDQNLRRLDVQGF